MFNSRHCLKLAVYISCSFTMMTLSPLNANAHLMPENHGTLKVIGTTAHAVVSLPITAFKDIDDDRDGYLSQQEYKTHKKKIKAQIASGIRLNALQTSVVNEGVNLMYTQDHGLVGKARYLVAIKRTRFSTPPLPLTLDLNILTTPMRITLKASHKDRQQLAIFTAEQPSQVLFE